MSDPDLITAHLIGTPAGGTLDDPWQPGRPAEGERVAIYAYDVLSTDGGADDLRSYHVLPIGQVAEGPLDADKSDPQGITVQWRGCGAGTVVTPSRRHEGDPRCEVRPDNASLL
jgi:hypothetical protein